MENITSKMDSVFDSVSDSVTDFDVMFDEDDHLVDVVEGFASNGKPLTGDEFEDIHLSDDEKGDLDSTSDLDDDCNPNDIKDALTGDELMGSSIKDIENGDEWDIEDNTKLFKTEEKDAAEKWFEDSDKEYQDSDFKGSVDPENINKSLEAQRESAMAFLESDSDKEDDDIEVDEVEECGGNKQVKNDIQEAMNFLENDTFDEEDFQNVPKKSRPDVKDAYTVKEAADDKEDDADDEEKVKEAADVTEPESLKEAMSFLEDTVHDDMDSTSDIMDKNPKDELDIEDEDDAESRKDDDAIGDGVGELKEDAAFLESEEEDLMDDDDFDDFDECGAEGILADNDEAKVHSDVQCDGSANCSCPACASKKLSLDSELAVGDTFKEAVAFLESDKEEDDTLEETTDEIEDVEETVKEDNTLEEAVAFLETEAEDPIEDVEDDIVDVADQDDGEADINLDYDPSDEDLIDLALSDD